MPPEKSIGYKYYLSGGIKAFQIHDDKKAIRYFNIAIIFYPGSKEARHYLEILGQRQEVKWQAMPQVPANLPSAQPQQAAVAPQIVPAVPVRKQCPMCRRHSPNRKQMCSPQPFRNQFHKPCLKHRPIYRRCNHNRQPPYLKPLLSHRSHKPCPRNPAKFIVCSDATVGSCVSFCHLRSGTEFKSSYSQFIVGPDYE